jgi:TRAP-type uncharacterized transport system substrate-binding protein
MTRISLGASVENWETFFPQSMQTAMMQRIVRIAHILLRNPETVASLELL